MAENYLGPGETPPWTDRSPFAGEMAEWCRVPPTERLQIVVDEANRETSLARKAGRFSTRAADEFWIRGSTGPSTGWHLEDRVIEAECRAMLRRELPPDVDASNASEVLEALAQLSRVRLGADIDEFREAARAAAGVISKQPNGFPSMSGAAIRLYEEFESLPEPVTQQGPRPDTPEWFLASVAAELSLAEQRVKRAVAKLVAELGGPTRLIAAVQCRNDGRWVLFTERGVGIVEKKRLGWRCSTVYPLRQFPEVRTRTQHMPDRTESVLEFVGAGKTRSEVVELRPPIGGIQLGLAAFDVGPSMVIADLDDGIRRMFAASDE